MRREREVFDKFQEVYQKTLQQRQKEYLDVSYINCKYNVRHRVKGNGALGFCTNPELLNRVRRPVFVCSDSETAECCSDYCCKHTPESVKMDLDDIMRSPGRVGQEYPKLATLLWCLQEGQDPVQLWEPETPNRWQRLKISFRSLWQAAGSVVIFRWW